MERLEKLCSETSYAQEIPPQPVAAVHSSSDESFLACNQHCEIVSIFLFLFFALSMIVYCISSIKHEMTIYMKL